MQVIEVTTSPRSKLAVVAGPGARDRIALPAVAGTFRDLYAALVAANGFWLPSLGLRFATGPGVVGSVPAR